MSEIAKNRAVLTDSSVIDARSLNTSHRRLAELLKPGMKVLDIGCGTGAITADIIDIVGETGEVVGVDNNQALIDVANEKYKDIPNLSFIVADIYNLPYENEFDIVTAARVLQWLDKPDTALKNMRKAVKPDGKLIVLDYNHEKIAWEPQIPTSMQNFYNDFLRWRAQSGMNNQIADHLSKMFASTGLKNVQSSIQNERVSRNDTDFLTSVNVWSGVVSFKGKQMVEEGFIKENDRALAELEYNQWIKSNAKTQEMYLLAVEGTK